MSNLDTTRVSTDEEFAQRLLHPLHPTTGPSELTTRLLAGGSGLADGALLGPVMLAVGVPSDPEPLRYVAGMVLGAGIALAAHQVGAVFAELRYRSAHQLLRRHAELWLSASGLVVLTGVAISLALLRGGETNANPFALALIQMFFVVLGLVLGFVSGDPNKAKAEEVGKAYDEAEDEYVDAVEDTAEAAGETVEAITEAMAISRKIIAGVGQRKAIGAAKIHRYEGHLTAAAQSIAETDGTLAQRLASALEGDHVDRAVLDTAFEASRIDELIDQLLAFEQDVLQPLLFGLGSWSPPEAGVDLDEELEELVRKVGVDPQDAGDIDLTEPDGSVADDDTATEAESSSNGTEAP
jgi:hypothetical protein